MEQEHGAAHQKHHQGDDGSNGQGPPDSDDSVRFLFTAAFCVRRKLTIFCFFNQIIAHIG